MHVLHEVQLLSTSYRMARHPGSCMEAALTPLIASPSTLLHEVQLPSAPERMVMDPGSCLEAALTPAFSPDSCVGAA